MNTRNDTIAIDFGTSRIKVAYWDSARGRPELMHLGADGTAYWPSLVYAPPGQGEVIWGSDAEEMEQDDPAGLIVALKRDLRKPTLVYNRRRLEPVRLLAALFACLRERAGHELPALNGRSPTRVVLTRPALFGPVEETLMQAAAKAAGFTEVELIPEPVAAARAWLQAAGGSADEVVVFDGGGGTIDWAWLRRQGTDFRVMPDCPACGWHVGGHDVDEELFARLVALAPELTEEIETKRTLILKRLRTIKENYSRGQAPGPIRIGRQPVTLPVAEIDAAIEQVFITQATAHLARYLEQIATVRNGPPPTVLLVGGGCHLRGLRQTLETRLGRPTQSWDRADFAVVLGAVPAVSRPPPPPPPPPPVEVLRGRWPDPGCVFRDWGPGGTPDPALPEMVVIPAGSFMMGSAGSEPGREPWKKGVEGPQHQVTLARPFALGRTAVTRGQFRRFVEATNHRLEGGAYRWDGSAWTLDPKRHWLSPGFEQTDDHPVVCVNWNDAQAYVAWLSSLTGAAWRLPSEAEWEYACRAGTTTPFWWGDTITTDQSNYDGNYTYNGGLKGDYRQRTVPVDSFVANPFGLYQMHGNVWEWVEDHWHDDYGGAPSDGSAWVDGNDTARGLRGGSWLNLPDGVRSAYRYWNTPGLRDNFGGVRVARTLNLGP